MAAGEEPVAKQYMRRYPEWREHLSAYTDATVLDLGCGRNAAVAVAAADENEVVQLDVRRDGLDALHDRYAEMDAVDPALVQGDGTALPFADDAFDVIWMGYSAAASAGPNPIRIPQTGFTRILAPDGDFYVAFDITDRSYSPRDVMHRVSVDAYADAFETITAGEQVLGLEGFQGADAAPRHRYSGDISHDQLDRLLMDADRVTGVWPNTDAAPLDVPEPYTSGRRIVEHWMQDYGRYPDQFDIGDPRADVLRDGDTLHVYADVPITDGATGDTATYHNFTIELSTDDAAHYLAQHDFAD